MDLCLLQKGQLLYFIIEREDLHHIKMTDTEVEGTNGVDINVRKKPSLSLLQRVLEWTHCQFVCLATTNSLKHLEENPSYDLLNDIYKDINLIEGAYYQALTNPGIFLDGWMSTRLDLEIRMKVESILS